MSTSTVMPRSTRPRPAALGWRAAELAAAVVLAMAVSTLVLQVVERLSVPEPSHMDNARLSFITCACVLAVAVVAWLHHRSRSGASGIIAWVVSTISVAVIGCAQLAVLLRGTPHYLFGLSGDQSFRVPYLARLAESPLLRDVFYPDAIPYYPPLWFWLGGRYANLAGLDGWEAYKPFALASMSAVAAIAFVGWRWLVGVPTAGLIAAATAAVGAHFNAYEPYSWAVIAVVPLLCVWAVRTTAALIDAAPGTALRQAPRPAVFPALIIGAVLGLAAMTYTLVAAVACLSVALAVGTVALAKVRNWGAGLLVLVWLVLTGLVALVVALFYWGRYVWALLTGTPHAPSVATDFLPENASTLSLPFTDPTAFGLAALLGLVVLTVAAGACWRRWLSEGPADTPLLISTGLLVATGTGYLWSLASLARAFTDSTLLAFRMVPLITLSLVIGGVYWLCQELFHYRSVGERLGGWTAPLKPTAAVLVVLLVMGMAQSVSAENREYSQIAHGSHPEQQAELLRTFDELVPAEARADTVVLSSEPKLFAYRDVFSFQAPGEAYATPFARYPERNEEIRRFAEAGSPQELIAALDSSEFEAPDVFILNRDEHGLHYPLFVNQLPLLSADSREPVHFHEAAFADPEVFEHRTAGPLEIYVRR